MRTHLGESRPITSLVMLSLLLGLGKSLVAQSGPDSFAWVPNVCANTFDLYDRNGTLAQQLSIPGTTPIFFPHMEKATDGLVWVSDSFFSNIQVLSSAGLVSTTSVTGFQDLSPHPSGDMWVLSPGGPFSPVGSLKLMRSSGVVLANVPLSGPGFATPSLTSDPFGNAWVIGSGTTAKVDASGATLVSVPSPPGAQGAVSDRVGRIWIESIGGIQVLDNSAANLAFIPLAGIDALAVDASGGVRALVSGFGGAQSIHHFDPVSLTHLGGVALSFPSFTQITQMRFDATGQIWCLDSVSSVWRLSPDAIQVTHVWSSATTLIQSMATGVKTSSVMSPGVDSDGDGVANELEVRSGSDCFDPLSVPLAVGFSGALVAGQTVTLSLNEPQQPGFLYLSGASFSAGAPGIRISPLFPHVVPLQMDPLLSFWVSPSNSFVLPSVSGVLDANGSAAMTLSLPVATTGFAFTLSLMTFDPILLTPALISLPQNVVIQ